LFKSIFGSFFTISTIYLLSFFNFNIGALFPSMNLKNKTLQSQNKLLASKNKSIIAKNKSLNTKITSLKTKNKQTILKNSKELNSKHSKNILDLKKKNKLNISKLQAKHKQNIFNKSKSIKARYDLKIKQLKMSEKLQSSAKRTLSAIPFLGLGFMLTFEELDYLDWKKDNPNGSRTEYINLLKDETALLFEKYKNWSSSSSIIP